MKQHFAHTTTKSIREALNIPKGTYFVGFKNGEPFYYEGKLSFPVMRLFVENLANDRIANYADKKQDVEERLTKNKPFVLVFS
jgi:protein disulfide-isomerase A1